MLFLMILTGFHEPFTPTILHLQTVNILLRLFSEVRISVMCPWYWPLFLLQNLSITLADLSA